MEAVEKHFRETHRENIIKPVETHTLSGTAARSLRSTELARLVRSIWEDQRRFPLQVATSLSQQFASRGLQFFKVNRTFTHVSVARPHFLDMEATPVSEGVKRIVDFINTHPKATRRQLVENLTPSAPAPAVIPVPIEGQPAPSPAAPEPTPEQTAVIADLHWLVHQGHVIEFANGILETAKKPAPKPAKPEPKTPASAPAADAGATSAAEAPEVETGVVEEGAAHPVPEVPEEKLAGTPTEVFRPADEVPALHAGGTVPPQTLSDEGAPVSGVEVPASTPESVPESR